MQGFAT